MDFQKYSCRSQVMSNPITTFRESTAIRQNSDRLLAVLGKNKETGAGAERAMRMSHREFEALVAEALEQTTI